MTAPSAHPLSWPQGFPRTRYPEQSRFKVTLPQALDNVERSLKLFGKDSGKPVSGIVLSSNVTLSSRSPSDAGVAVWFTWEGNQICIPCDRYRKVEENLQAIHHVLEARRTELRHGTLQLVRATFAGFRALPAPPGKGWRSILKLEAPGVVSKADIERQYRLLAAERHPDKGGSAEAMAELNNAKDTALKEIGA